MKYLVYILMFCTILGAGCSSKPVSVEPTDTATHTAIITSIPTIRPTQTPTSTQKPMATSTISPMPTETLTPTETAPIQPLVVIKLVTVNVRSGPGDVYPVLASFATGIFLEALGRNEDNTWLLVRIGEHQSGWISTDVVEIITDIDDLSVAEIPPTHERTPSPQEIPTILIIKTTHTDAKKINLTPYTVQILHFQPFEVVTFSITSTVSGRVIYTREFTVNSQGYYTFEFNYSGPKTETVYVLTAIGNKGTSATIQAVLKGQ